MEDAALSVTQTEEVFLRMLIQANADRRSVAMLPVYKVFKTFARIPVKECPEIEVLVQWGLNDLYTEREMFQFDLTRQLSIFEDGAYARTEQLHCVLFFDIAPELAPPQGNGWSMDFDNLDEFFAGIETLDAFNLIRDMTPAATRVSQERV